MIPAYHKKCIKKYNPEYCSSMFLGIHVAFKPECIYYEGRREGKHCYCARLSPSPTAPGTKRCMRAILRTYSKVFEFCENSYSGVTGAFCAYISQTRSILIVYLKCRHKFMKSRSMRHRKIKYHGQRWSMDSLFWLRTHSPTPPCGIGYRSRRRSTLHPSLSFS